MIEEMYPQLTPTQRDQMVNNNFIEYFKNYAALNKYDIDQRLITMSIGPRREINSDHVDYYGNLGEIWELRNLVQLKFKKKDDKTYLLWVVPTKTFARIQIDWTNIQDDDDNNDDFFQEDENMCQYPFNQHWSRMTTIFLLC
ncbi:hypothetical protein LIER_41950 [Lithospermum erythrorhizon]|uniref:Uncharacterized protein n=1 Tax=Lithospermum erythrorhizon TaxID=34254 RepID=A0AAV3RIQ1_LITER